MGWPVGYRYYPSRGGMHCIIYKSFNITIGWNHFCIFEYISSKSLMIHNVLSN
ncbi:hypothetical protein B0I18_1062 [Taibaiella chishuiensis]|uniref:Uncharacterized protein n=1 Tax=Taibaiella chishuiensis TaxID=1434707 RepID=A0A2P8D199_9BACT|nr:hypothetical protein B0I18_1062 [Taibaiella chishuiensis]